MELDVIRKAVLMSDAEEGEDGGLYKLDRDFRI